MAVIRTAMMVRCRMVAGLRAVHCCLICVGLQTINKGRGVYREEFGKMEKSCEIPWRGACGCEIFLPLVLDVLVYLIEKLCLMSRFYERGSVRGLEHEDCIFFFYYNRGLPASHWQDTVPCLLCIYYSVYALACYYVLYYQSMKFHQLCFLFSISNLGKQFSRLFSRTTLSKSNSGYRTKYLTSRPRAHGNTVRK